VDIFRSAPAFQPDSANPERTEYNVGKGVSMMKACRVGLAVLLGVSLAGFAAAEAQKPDGYHLIKKHVLGGEGGWDYMALDGRSRLLYVSHGSAVEILNVDTGVKGEAITGLQGVHGVAFAPERDRGYISNGRGNSVSVFDLKTHKVLETVPSSGQNPDAIMYDAFSGRVFTFNGRTANATAIDAATNKVVGTVDIGGKPEFAVTDGQGTIFVNNEDKSEIVAFDAKSLAVKKHWSIAPGEGPSGLAIDLKGNRLFSVCDKVMVVSDFEKGTVVTTVPIGEGPDAVRYDAGTGLIFASNGEGTLTVVKQESADKYTVLETVATARGARTLELDPKTHHVFVVTAEFGPAPAPTQEQPRPRPAVIPGSFMVLEFGK
jgi:DNA-binding beta-propeller fold protein YncE